MDGNLFIWLHVSTGSYVWSHDDIYNSGDYCPSWTAVFHHFFLFSSFQFDWLTASLLFIPRDRTLARGTCFRHLYCSNHSDQTWDKYDVFFYVFAFFFFDLREIYSVWDAFLPWPSSILAECASEKMHIMTAFSFELVVCVFAPQLWCLWRFLVSVYCTEMVAGNSSLLENLGWRPPKRELFSHSVCRGLIECKQRNKKWTKSCGEKKQQVSSNEM